MAGLLGSGNTTVLTREQHMQGSRQVFQQAGVAERTGPWDTRLEPHPTGQGITPCTRNVTMMGAWLVHITASHQIKMSSAQGPATDVVPY